jgi:DNA repair photolyase
LLKSLQKEASGIGGQTVSISNSSDPYPKLEAQLGVTRECLKILSKEDCKIQIITKSTLVARDADILSQANATVAMTITTDDDNLARILEPDAPSPTERVKAVETLLGKGIPVSVRIDPIILFVNDHPEKLIASLAELGVKHITASTYKAKPDNWRRLAAAMPCETTKLEPLYFQRGEKVGGSTVLPKDLRFNLMSNMRRTADAYGMKFGVCREGISQLNTASCDGSWLMPKHRGEQ